MPTLKLCKHGATTPTGRCPQCRIQDRTRRTNRITTHGYASAHWQHLRQARLALALNHCELQLPGCTTTATHVHLDPSAHGDHRNAQLEQTRACCPNCSGAIDAPRASQSHQGGLPPTGIANVSATRARHSREKLGMV